jgi:YesN/AraC family two-component response regulator
MDSVLIVATELGEKKKAFDAAISKFPNLRQCWFAASRKEAVRIIKKEKPSLVILDVDMASKLDFEIFEQTKLQDYFKIIICDSDAYAFKVLRFGIDDYLLSPVSAAVIETSLERLLFLQKRYKIQELYRRRSTLVMLTTAFVATENGRHAVEIADVMRIRDTGQQRVIHMASGKQLCTFSPMSELLLTFAGNGFVQISIDQAINCRHVTDLQLRSGRHYARMSDRVSLRLTMLLAERIRQRMGADAFPRSEQYPIEGFQ